MKRLVALAVVSVTALAVLPSATAAPVAGTVKTKISVSAPPQVVAGAKFRVTGKVTVHKKKPRVVVLSKKAGKKWKVIRRQKTTKRGAFAFTVPSGTKVRTRKFRVTTRRAKYPGKVLSRARRGFSTTVITGSTPPGTTVSLNWSATTLPMAIGGRFTATGKVGGVEPEERYIYVEQQTRDGVWHEIGADDYYFEELGDDWFNEFKSDEDGNFTIDVPSTRYFTNMPTRVRVDSGYDPKAVTAYSAPVTLTTPVPWTPTGALGTVADDMNGRARWDSCRPLKLAIDYTNMTNDQSRMLWQGIEDFSMLTGIEVIEAKSFSASPQGLLSTAAGVDYFPAVTWADVALGGYVGPNSFNLTSIVRTSPGRDAVGGVRNIQRATAYIHFGGPNLRARALKTMLRATGAGRSTDTTQVLYDPVATNSLWNQWFGNPTAAMPGVGDLEAIGRDSWQAGCIQVG